MRNFSFFSLLLGLIEFLCFFRRQKTSELAGSDEEDVDELSLIDHKEIMSRITLKQEVRQTFSQLAFTVQSALQSGSG